MKSIGTWLGAIALGAALAGCGGQSAVQPAGPEEGGQQGQAQMNGAPGQGQELGYEQQNQQPEPGEERPEKHKVYFGFDKSNVQSEYTDLLTKTAAYLIAHPNQNVRLEGYTDERGTKAYNIALGDRRAQSVKRFLMLQGVSPDQLETVSYGEENAAVSGHNPQAWSKNRRVVIAYR